jgi:hypothetical protein
VLHGSGDFWKYEDEGLAIFLADGFSQIYRLPLSFPQLVVVANRFMIKPLLPLLAGDGRFLILALSQNAVRLFRATRYSLQEVTELPGVPANLDEVLQYDEAHKELQFFAGAASPGAGGRRAAVFYSSGGSEQSYKKEALLRYCQQIDTGLHSLLRHENVPLVVAAVDYLVAIYRQANHYPHLLSQAILGSPDRFTPDELRHKAWAIVEPHLRLAQAQAIDHFWRVAKKGQASGHLQKIVPAAYAGRVATLFTAVDQQQWGHFDSQSGEVQLHETAEPSDEELLDLAAYYTLRAGGIVYALPAADMPGEVSLAAIFRY